MASRVVVPVQLLPPSPSLHLSDNPLLDNVDIIKHLAFALQVDATVRLDVLQVDHVVPKLINQSTIHTVLLAGSVPFEKLALEVIVVADLATFHEQGNDLAFAFTSYIQFAHAPVTIVPFFGYDAKKDVARLDVQFNALFPHDTHLQRLGVEKTAVPFLPQLTPNHLR